MVNVFSVSAFFIVLREVLEACLVVGVALAYFQRTGNTQYNRWVWLGAIAGILVSFAFGISFAIVYFVNGDQIFKGKAEKVFEGIMFLVAAALLTWMIIWMLYMGQELQKSLEKKLEQIVADEDDPTATANDDEKSSSRKRLGVFTMVFVQVLREGIETFIFLFGSANADDVGGWRGIPLPGILAVIVGIGVSFLVFKGLVNVDIQRFFDISSLVLIAFAAGLTSHAFHELQEADWFGPWDKPEDAETGWTRDWYNVAMWKTVNCCNDKDNQFFAMLRALFGYQDKPTFLEWVTYFAYWVIVIVIYVNINWARIRAARSRALSRAQGLVGSALIFGLVGFIFAAGNASWIGLLTMIVAFGLSIASTVAVFDVVAVRVLGAMRRTIFIGLGVAWGIWTLVMCSLHMYELICDGTDTCGGLKKFYFFGLVLTDDFNQLGVTELYKNGGMDDKAFTAIWPSIAVLSISMVMTFFFYGGLAFRMVLAGWNVAADGTYMDDDHVAVGGEEDEMVPQKVLNDGDDGGVEYAVGMMHE